MHAIQYLLFSLLVTAIIAAFVVVVVPTLHDEITEFRAVSRRERKKCEKDNDDFFTKLRAEQKAWFDWAYEKPCVPHDFG